MQCPNCRIGKLIPPEDNHPSYLICDSCSAIQLRYFPQDYQEPIHTVPYVQQDNGYKLQVMGVFGGYGSGKSKDSLQEVFLRSLENSNGTGLFTAPTLQQLKRTTLKMFFNEICPPPLIENYNKSDGEIRLINGFVWYTIPSDDEEKLRSINAGICHMEEASGIKRSIFDQILTRLRDPFTKNRLFMVCSNPEQGWIKDVFVDNEARSKETHPEHDDYNPYIYTFVWPTKLNRYLPADFIEMNSRGKPEWWKRKYLEGSFEAAEGAVYPNVFKCFVDSSEYTDFSKPKQMDKHGIPVEWERCVSMDWGARNPTAVYFHAINPVDGEVWTYDEYYVPNTLLPEHAKNLKPRIDEIPAGRLRFMVADPSIRNKNDVVNGKSVQGLFQEYGMYFTPGNNNIEAGILRVNSYIERGKWKIFRDKCPNLCREAINYKFPELSMDELNKNLDEKPIKANDHSVDSVRYFFMRMPEDPDMLKNLAFEAPTVYNRYEKVENEWHYSQNRDDSGKDWASFGY